MRFLLLFFSFGLLFTAISKAQVSLIPVKYTLESAADYRQYEKNVLSSIEWLINTPRNKELTQRKKVEDFVVKWIYGTPYISVVIEPYAMKLSRKNADLLLSFIFGYTEYKLKNLNDKDAISANVAGINHMIKDYKFNISILTLDPTIDEVIELQSAGKLTDWVKPQLTMGNKIFADH